MGIPAFDEERTVAKVIIRSKKHAETVLVVDDGSEDDTALIAENLGAVLLKHGKNLGKGAAIRDCFRWARRTAWTCWSQLMLTARKLKLSRSRL